MEALTESELEDLTGVYRHAFKANSKQLKALFKEMEAAQVAGTMTEELARAYYHSLSDHFEISSTFHHFDDTYNDAVESQAVNSRDRFVRPSKGVAGLLSRLLPKTDDDAVIVHPTKLRLKQTRTSRLLAAGALVGVLVFVFGLSYLVPWTRTSPYTLIADFSVSLWGDLWGTIASTVFLLICLVAVGWGTVVPRYRGTQSFIDKAAMLEEQWFRMGAEKWNTAQRVWSCLVFGFMHVINIIYSVSLLLAIAGMGAILMAVYLREYRKTQSVEKALLASTKLHATYNRFGFVYMGIAMVFIFGQHFLR